MPAGRGSTLIKGYNGLAPVIVLKHSDDRFAGQTCRRVDAFDAEMFSTDKAVI